MKKIFLTSLFIAGLISPAITHAGSKDDKGVKDLVAQFVTEWNKHDAKKMAALWTEDGTLINPAGRIAQGRDNIEKFFADEHGGPFKESKMEMSVSSIRMAGKDLAFVDVDADLTGIASSDGKSPGLAKHHVVFLAEKKKGDWSFLDARPYSFIRFSPDQSDAGSAKSKSKKDSSK